MIVLSQGDDVPLGGDLESAASGDFDLRAVKVGHELAGTVKDCHVEL
jgi:hypothetical protein